MRSDARVTARIVRLEDGTRVREYSVGRMTYPSIDALQAALSAR